MGLLVLAVLTIAVCVPLYGHSASASWCGSSDVIPNYAAIKHPKRVLSIPQAHGVCVAQNGHFAVISWNTERKFRIFDAHAKLLKTAVLPQGTRPDDCAFAPTAIYISDPATKRLLKYSTTGDFIKAIATFVYYYNRLSWCNGYLYAGIPPLRKIAVFYDDKEIQRFDIKVTDMISTKGGISFDTNRNLYAAVQPNKVQIFNIHGKPSDTLTFNEVGVIDGLVLDHANNVVVTDRMAPPSTSVKVYSPYGVLIKKITGFNYTSDVDIATDGSLLVADWMASKLYIF